MSMYVHAGPPDAPGTGSGAALRQLALPFAHRPRFGRTDFLEAGSNRAALAWLAPGAAARWPSRRLALWGEAGGGKTHLLHVWAREHDALLLPGTALRDLGALFRAPDRWGGVAVDDADVASDERALLHALNAVGEGGLPVLLAARTAPARWNVALPDLRSRLRAMEAVQLGRPDDALLRVLLLRLLAERQLMVAPAVVDWLLQRLPRTAAAMRELAQRLDERAMASGRGIGRALAALVLGDMLSEAPEDTAAVAEEDPGEVPLL